MLLQNCDIIHVTGVALNHFAVAYVGRDSMTWIYEAWPPTVHRMPLSQWLARWDSWLCRLVKVKLFVLAATPDLTPAWQYNMQIEADDRLGVKYGWLSNYWLKLRGYDHCLEYIARQQIWAGLVYPVEPSRITPRIFLETTLASGWWREETLLAWSRNRS